LVVVVLLLCGPSSGWGASLSRCGVSLSGYGANLSVRGANLLSSRDQSRGPQRSAPPQGSGSGPARPGRSPGPDLTEEPFAVGAGPQVVGVSSYDDFPPETKALPRVGALLDPDTERILSLRPDLVVVYGSQTELETQFTHAGIRVYPYRHGGIDSILQAIRDVARLTGRPADGDRVIGEVRS